MQLGYGVINGVSYYGCCKCQKQHFEDEPIYQEHIYWQSKHGIFQMTQKDFIAMRLKEIAEASGRSDG